SAQPLRYGLHRQQRPRRAGSEPENIEAIRRIPSPAQAAGSRPQDATAHQPPADVQRLRDRSGCAQGIRERSVAHSHERWHLNCRVSCEVKIWPGNPYPLGATYDGAGTNFSVFSEVATRVELCLFDDKGSQSCVDLPEMTGFIWHGYLPNISPGQRYGFRVHGPWDPARGQRCN